MEGEDGPRTPEQHEDSGLISKTAPEPAKKSKRKHANGYKMLGKGGDDQVTMLNVPNKHKRFAQDLFNTLVECQWRYTLLVFLLSHFVSWFLFAMVWYLMAVMHGDMEETVREVGDLPCLINVADFTSAFIFSMESQTTIGYGTAYPSRDCPQAVVVLCFQSVCGMIIEAFSVGIVFAKLTRPQVRSQTLLFSKKAVIAMRKGCLTLMFRVGDIRKAPLVNAKLWVVIRGVSDCDDTDIEQRELAVTFNGGGKNLSTLWPTTVMHKVDETSPLYRYGPNDLMGESFEVLVYLEGTIQATGQTTQARTSYSPHEIMWGHTLYPMMKYNKKHGRYEANYNHFHGTIEVETPLCSSAALNRVRRLSELSAILRPISESREELVVQVESV